MSERTERCENCRFWERLVDNLYGFCRRLPPRVSESIMQQQLAGDNIFDMTYNDALLEASRFPIALEDQWCGEHEAINVQPSAEVLRMRVKKMQFSLRARKCFNRLGIETLGDLIKYSADDLLELNNFGMTTLSEVRDILSALGLNLRNDP